MTASGASCGMSGMSPELIERLIDGIRMRTLAVQTIYRNGQFMSLLAHAGILKEPEDLEQMIELVQRQRKDDAAGEAGQEAQVPGVRASTDQQHRQDGRELRS